MTKQSWLPITFDHCPSKESKFLITCLFLKQCFPKLVILLWATHLDVLYFQFSLTQMLREADIFRQGMLLCTHPLTDSHSYGLVLTGVLTKATNFAEKLRVFTFGDSSYNWRWSPATRINCRKKRNKAVNKGKRLCCFEKPWYKLRANENHWENGVLKRDSLPYRDI